MRQGRELLGPGLSRFCVFPRAPASPFIGLRHRIMLVARRVLPAPTSRECPSHEVYRDFVWPNSGRVAREEGVVRLRAPRALSRSCCPVRNKAARPCSQILLPDVQIPQKKHTREAHQHFESSPPDRRHGQNFGCAPPTGTQDGAYGYAKAAAPKKKVCRFCVERKSRIRKCVFQNTDNLQQIIRHCFPKTDNSKK